MGESGDKFLNETFVVLGGVGAGSVAIEAALTLLGLPYRTQDVVTPIAGDGDAAVRFNPMNQVPALLTPGGELITESAAMLIWLAERFPDARLSPAPGDPRRAQFLRWMAFVSSAIYGLYWVRDMPSRIARDEAQEEVVRQRTAERILFCWSVMESQIESGTYFLGEDLGVLDLYVAVVSRWGPRRRGFYGVAPRMGEIVRRVDADPRLADLWAQRFPFSPGWEGCK